MGAGRKGRARSSLGAPVGLLKTGSAVREALGLAGLVRVEAADLAPFLTGEVMLDSLVCDAWPGFGRVAGVLLGDPLVALEPAAGLDLEAFGLSESTEEP